MGKDRVQRLIQIINKIPLFQGLGPSQVQAVLGACTPRRFEAGQVLCEADTPGDELFILLTGEAGIYGPDGTEHVGVQPIATIGEMSIATRQTRTSTVKAKQLCNVLVMKRVGLDVALKADHEAQAKILRNVVAILAQRMERENERRLEAQVQEVQHQEALQQLQRRADVALGILARKGSMPLAEARRLLDEEMTVDASERRVLVVDDEDHVRTMITKVLANYDVTTVGSGAAALEAAMESTPDLVITDIRMPDMDGFELLRRLREYHPELPVLALSGYVQADDVQEYDFDGFVAKPMDLEQFRSTVAAVLARVTG